MVRNDYWNFDQDLEGVRSLGAVLDDASFVLSLQGMRLMLDLNQFRGCEGPQPISANLFVANLTQILYKYGACLEAMQPTRTGIYCYRFFHRIG